MNWLKPSIIAVILGLSAMAQAAESKGEIRVGEIGDFSGPYAILGGKGSVTADNLAIEDFGKVLGMPVKVLPGDTQNKADIASSIAQKWFDTDHVSAVLNGGATPTAAAILQVARDRKKPFLAIGTGSLDFTGKLCTPYFSQWAQDTYMLANGAAHVAAKSGGGTWFFITADYSYGYSLQEEITKRITAMGGKVLGSVRHPLGAADYSSFLLQAQASGAKYIALANSGLDMQNAVRQAREFGIAQGGQQVIPMVIYDTDVQALGLQNAQGLIGVTSFFAALNDATRKFAVRFMEKEGHPPTMVQAAGYSAMYHLLRAIKAAGTDDGEKVTEQIRALPIDDPILTGASVRVDGKVMRPVYLVQVKAPAESKGPTDLFNLIETIPPDEAWRSLPEGGCPLAK